MTCRGKPALFLAVLILAGCGGSPRGNPQTIRGNGFRFAAPAGWHVTNERTVSSATHDSELLQVMTFPLQKPYTDALFARVTVELEARMRAVAKQVGGSVAGSKTVTAAGIRSHAYDIEAGGHVDEYTFVLRGKREYQLLCRRKSSTGKSLCGGLTTSFVLA